jgi:hypothetical protein
MRMGEDTQVPPRYHCAKIKDQSFFFKRAPAQSIARARCCAVTALGKAGAQRCSAGKDSKGGSCQIAGNSHSFTAAPR